MYYDKQIRYIDYLENGEKQRNCGYVKMTVTDNRLLLEMQIKGLYETDDVASEVALEGAGTERRIGTVQIRQGGGSFRWDLKDPEHAGEALAIGDGLCYGQLERVQVQLSPRRSLRCVWREELPRAETSKQVQEVSEPTKRVQEAVEPIKRIQEAEEPAKWVREAAEPAKRVQEASEPAKWVQEAAEPAKRVREASEPTKRIQETAEQTNRIQEAAETAKRVQEASEPTKRIQETAEQTNRIQEAAETAKRVREAAEPAKRVREAAEPTKRVQGAAEPAYGTGKAQWFAAQGTGESNAAQIQERGKRPDSEGHRQEAVPRAAEPIEVLRKAGERPDNQETTYGREASASGTIAAAEGRAVGARGEKMQPDATEEKEMEEAKADRVMTADFAGNGSGNPAGKKSLDGNVGESGDEAGHVSKEAELHQADAPDVSGKAGAAPEGSQAPLPPQMASMSEDKWQQLWKIYPHIRPFQDEREYLSLRPEDFVILHSGAYRLVQNSFLLHGYFNYEHLILTQVSQRNGNQYYIGVPGNFYEKEKQVAIMYGFGSFECKREPAREGDFGYYMIKVEL